MPFVRWLLVPLLLLSCIYGSVGVGMLVMRQVLQACGAPLQPGLMCTAPWYPAAEAAVAALCACVAMFSGVLLPTMLAPSRKRTVALACTAVGLAAIIAILVLLAFPPGGPVTASLTTAAFANWLISRRHRKASERNVPAEPHQSDLPQPGRSP